MLRSCSAALRHFILGLALPWSKPQCGTFLHLAGAFWKRRSLPSRRFTRSITGPNAGCRCGDRRLRRFLGSDPLRLPPILAAYLAFRSPRFRGRAVDPVALDWTFVQRHAILWAPIRCRGRSFPLCGAIYAATRANPATTHQTEAEVAFLQTLAACWPPGAPPPVLVADRGLDKGALLDWLVRTALEGIL